MEGIRSEEQEGPATTKKLLVSKSRRNSERRCLLALAVPRPLFARNAVGFWAKRFGSGSSRGVLKAARVDMYYIDPFGSGQDAILVCSEVCVETVYSPTYILSMHTHLHRVSVLHINTYIHIHIYICTYMYVYV